MNGSKQVWSFLTLVLVAAGPVQAAEPKGDSGVPWPTGEIEIVSGTLPCRGEGCTVQVTCSGAAVAERAVLKVGMPTGSPEKGTVLLMTGGGGRQLYEEQAPQIVEQLRTAGFRTVQLAWVEAWLFSSPGEVAGHARLACRPATVARWVHEHLHSQELAFCAAGNSGGSMQISYMLSHYGLEGLFDTVVPSGGPPTGRLDWSCLGDDPEHAALRFGVENNSRLIDRGFGSPPDGSGPCSVRDDSFRDRFRQASVASGDGDYFYPRTLVWFLFGEKDRPNIARGMTYHDLLVQSGSPLVRSDILPGVPHGVHRSPTGADKIVEVLVRECRPR